LILIGFTAAIAQIVMLRELMVVFSGNEISIGLMLAGWLFWTAVGSRLANRFAVGSPRRLTAAVEALLALAFPCTILAVRSVKIALGAVPGEMLGPGPMLYASLATLSLFCILSGTLFTAGSRLYANQSASSTASATGSAYLLEALGSSAGGMLAGLVLVRYLGSLEIASLVALLNLAAAAALTVAAPRPRLAALCGILALCTLAALPGGVPRLERISERYLWRGFHLIATRNSVYGNLAVVGSEASRSVYENGVALFHAPDPAAAEESVHYALLEHPAPHTLLLIGGGVNGSISQALRHPGLERVDYVELDPAILDLARLYFPDEWSPVEADSRVRVHVTDGRLFLKTTDATFDVVIVNLPDPQTAQLNRFYTVEFFQEAARRLTPTGVLSFRLSSSEDYMSPELAEFLRTIHKSLRAVFPEVAAIPGETVHFFAAKRAGILASGAAELLSRLRERHLETTYVREYYIPFRMAPDRMRELEARIRPDSATPVNHDFAPIAYYFDVALWSSRFNQQYRRLFRAAANVGFARLACGVGAFLLALVVGRRRPRVAAACCTAAMGFTLIGLEIMLLLAFQAIYGYVYHQLAVLIAGFMAGIALGAWLVMRSFEARNMRALACLQIAAALTALLLCAVFQGAARVTSPAGLFIVSQVLFPGLAVACGMLGGAEFPIASRVFFVPGRTSGPGTLYALDLAGSCLGAILFSAYFVPVFGFFKTAVVSAMVSLAPAVMAMRPASETDPAP